MSNELSSPPIGPAPASSALVEYVIKNRSTVATVLAILGVVCLVAAIYCFYKAFSPPPVSDEAKQKLAEKLKLSEDDAEVAATIPHQNAYIIGGIVGLMGAVVGIGVAAFAGMSIPQPSRSGQLTDARLLILLSGALFGLVLMTGGLFYFYHWFDSLTLGLEQKKLGELKWVLGPVLVFLIGAGLAFVAAQPARADERDNVIVRRMIYGTNFGLTIMLVILALLVGNVLIALKVPNRLDTTESGLHTLELSKEMQEYVVGLKKTIRVYAILAGEDPTTLDTRRLLESCQQANPDRFNVRYLSPVLNQKDIQQLKNKYPQVEIDQTGVLFVLDDNDNDKVATYVRKSEFEKRDMRSQRRDVEYVGQTRVAQELLFLTESNSEAIVYVTHTARELALVPAEDRGAEGALQARAATELRTALENVRCRVLRLPAEQPNVEYKIPDDADIVVVADPLSPLSEKLVTALEKYMANPRPNGKPKGKLLVLAGANPQPGSRALLATGLDSLLIQYGIQLPPTAVYARPVGRRSARTVVAFVNPNLAAEGNTIALSLEGGWFELQNCRRVLSTQAAPTIRTQPFLLSDAERHTWLETEVLANPEQTWSEMLKAQNSEVFTRKAFGQSNRWLGVLATETTEDKPTGRIVVIGSGTFADDQVRTQSGVAMQVDLFAASANWLRDRPAVANMPSKTYGYYTPPKSVNVVRILWFPIALVIGGVGALGLGVWVLRRK